MRTRVLAFFLACFPVSPSSVAVAGPNLNGWCYPPRPLKGDRIAIPSPNVIPLRPEFADLGTRRLAETSAIRISRADYLRYTGKRARERYQYLIRGSVAASDEAGPRDIVRNWPATLRFEAYRSPRTGAFQLIVWQSYDGPGTDHDLALTLDAPFPVASVQLDCRVYF